MNVSKLTEQWIAFGFGILILLMFIIPGNGVIQDAALQRQAIVDPQTATNSLVIFNIIIPLLAAYFLLRNSGWNLTIQDLWENRGAKIGLIAGFFSIFVIGRGQIFYYISNILVMMAFGYFMNKRFGNNLIVTLLIPFTVGYYYMFVQLLGTGGLELASLFQALTLTVFVWVAPILSAIIVYIFYKGWFTRMRQ